MKGAALALLITSGLISAAPPAVSWSRLKSTIEHYLGRPYVWGSSGLRSFDCSGFVWRAMHDSGISIKRTTARKLYLCLPPAPKSDPYQPGNLVFFDDLKHVGIVNGPNSFYHAESSVGTNLSKFDPYWRKKISGFRRLPLKVD
ncbi:MAG: C40 family peptidase [Acidobacteria bacterium]|nr:C40 family peptidase [Acidobacteriota bacterium]